MATTPARRKDGRFKKGGTTKRKMNSARRAPAKRSTSRRPRRMNAANAQVEQGVLALTAIGGSIASGYILEAMKDAVKDFKTRLYLVAGAGIAGAIAFRNPYMKAASVGVAAGVGPMAVYNTFTKLKPPTLNAARRDEQREMVRRIKEAGRMYIDQRGKMHGNLPKNVNAALPASVNGSAPYC